MVVIIMVVIILQSYEFFYSQPNSFSTFSFSHTKALSTTFAMSTAPWWKLLVKILTIQYFHDADVSRLIICYTSSSPLSMPSSTHSTSSMPSRLFTMSMQCCCNHSTSIRGFLYCFFILLPPFCRYGYKFLAPMACFRASHRSASTTSRL